jgi:hypothetical protein
VDSIVSVKGTVKAQLRTQGSVGPQSANVGVGYEADLGFNELSV